MSNQDYEDKLLHGLVLYYTHGGRHANHAERWQAASELCAQRAGVSVGDLNRLILRKQRGEQLASSQFDEGGVL